MPAPAIPPGAPASLAALGLLSTAPGAVLAGNSALRTSLPVDGPGLVASPAMVLNTAAPAATPTLVSPVVSNALSSRFNFLGGKYIIPSNTSPLSGYATLQQMPSVTLGFGSASVEFSSDTPAITFQHARSQNATTAVFVNDVEVFRIVAAQASGTAQAGAAGSITLASGASAFDAAYFNSWVHITSGTGAGQYAQVTGYTGATKVATIQPTWTTAPDATSVYEVTDTRANFSNSTNTGVGTYFPTLTYNERRFRRYRVEHSGQAFMGVYVSGVIDTVLAPPKQAMTPCLWAGDSFGTVGSDLGLAGTMPRLTCNMMGWECRNVSAPGTGIVNPGGSTVLSFNLMDRMLPPVNAWVAQMNGATGGSAVFTQGGASATVHPADSLATIQAAFDTAFGAGAFRVVYGGAGTQLRLWMVGQGAAGAITTPMTAVFSGLTGNTAATTSTLTPWLGDLNDHVPRDLNGNVLPFHMVVAVGHNDTTSSSTSYTPAAVQAAHTALIAGVQQKYPGKVTLFMIGSMFLPGGTVQSDVTTCNAAIKAAAMASLPPIRGVVPFIDTLTPAYSTGSGGQGGQGLNSPKGDGNSDIWMGPDNVHPRTLGQIGYAVGHARNLQAILGL